MAEGELAGLAGVLYARLGAHARLRHLQLLVAVGDGGSVASAARKLNLSQPAATQALAELERVLGIPLFERHARGMRATAAGLALLAAARSALDGLRDTAESLAAIRHGATTALRLGSIPAASQSLVATLLAAFCEAHPDVHVDLIEDSAGRLLPLVQGGALDAAFCREPLSLPAGCRFDALLADEVVVVAAKDHPLAGRCGLVLQDLAPSIWIRPPLGTQLREVFERVVLPALPGADWLQVSTISVTIAEGLLERPGAVGLLPATLAPVLLRGGRVVRLDMRLEQLLRPIGVVREAGKAPLLLDRLLGLAASRENANRQAGFTAPGGS